jgi:hypothetical protein
VHTSQKVFMFEGLEGVKVVAGRCRRKLWRPFARHSRIPSNVVKKKDHRWLSIARCQRGGFYCFLIGC